MTHPKTDSMASVLATILIDAGEVALRHFGHVSADLKDDGTQITVADKEVEEVLLSGLTRAFPQAGIKGEEGAAVSGNDGTWYVDPIDGTSSFVEGLAHWGPTVCLIQEGRLEAGALWLPRLKEFWYARRGQGAWRNDQRLCPPHISEIGHHHSLYVPSRFHERPPLTWPGKIRGLGSSATHLAMVASGGAAATIVWRWEPWDVGCGMLLVREAGRVVGEVNGRPFHPIEHRGLPIVAGAPTALHYLANVTLGKHR
ncbi:MAG: inositol monophosphatase [Proteobacteria bacterium]|jgi:myo-inositol-1(or 4)-monophosphatase|nr:inositol monophosphatase [Pseudomonadota bacterium]